MNAYLHCSCGSAQFKNLKNDRVKRRKGLRWVTDAHLAGTCRSCGKRVERVVKDLREFIGPIYT